jgi:radical SAM/SPASM domain FxsB family protein
MVAPLTTFIVKVASRCNLDCDYCYIYHHVDQSWRTQPRFMPPAVVDAAAGRIARHAAAHGLNRILVVLHGGEPTLAGPAWVDGFCDRVHRAIPDGVEVDFAMQSNGTLLDQRWLPVLARQRIRVGISLDGPREANDRHRRNPAGRSSYDATVAGIEFLRTQAPDAYAGILCVVDLANDPAAVYRHLAGFDPPFIDFGLPHAHWDNPPPGVADGAARYGEWLIGVFEAWAAGEQYRHSIRFFEDIIGLSVGAEKSIESLGLAPVTLLVIESDGSLQGVDTLKTAYDSAPDLGLNVTGDDLDQALTAPMIATRQAGTAALSRTCRQCDLVTVCGGGYLPHRYSTTNGFDNPSVYCADLQLLIRHIQRRCALTPATSIADQP